MRDDVPPNPGGDCHRDRLARLDGCAAYGANPPSAGQRRVLDSSRARAGLLHRYYSGMSSPTRTPSFCAKNANVFGECPKLDRADVGACEVRGPELCLRLAAFVTQLLESRADLDVLFSLGRRVTSASLPRSRRHCARLPRRVPSLERLRQARTDAGPAGPSPQAAWTKYVRSLTADLWLNSVRLGNARQGAFVASPAQLIARQPPATQTALAVPDHRSPQTCWPPPDSRHRGEAVSSVARRHLHHVGENALARLLSYKYYPPN